MSQSKVSVPYSTTFWVVPGQFLAGEHPVELDEDVTVVRLTALLDVGIRTFVDLTEEEEKMQGYARRLRTLATDRQMDIAIVRIPIRDRGVPSAATLTCVLDLIDSSIANGNPVFVHCFAGVGRTGTMVGCHLMRHGRTTEHEVIAKISELRSLMPGGREPSPHTPEQIQVVKNWKSGS